MEQESEIKRPCHECGQELEEDREHTCHRCAPVPRTIMACNYWKLDKKGKDAFREFVSWLAMKDRDFNGKK